MKFFKTNCYALAAVLFFLMNNLFADSPAYGPGDDWDAITTTSQGFIIFDELFVNGEPVENGVDDGSTFGSCDSEDCDIIALYYPGTNWQTSNPDTNIIGWSYCTVSNEDVTVAVNLNDFSSPFAEAYPGAGSFVTAILYDASEGMVYFGLGQYQIFPLNQVSGGIIDVTGDGSYAGLPAGCPSIYADNFNPLAGSGDMDLCDFSILGCTNSEACNYDDPGNADCAAIDDYCEDDGTCLDYDCSYDPQDDTTWEGACGGDAVADCAGECNGDAEEDCEGDCNGTAEWDECGFCAGTNFVDSCLDTDDCEWMDCSGECFGAAELDECGFCAGNNFIDTCLGSDDCDSMDCAGICYDGYNPDDESTGNSYGAELDECGFCAGNNFIDTCLGSDDCDSMDCNGDCSGAAIIDGCGVCSDGNSGHPFNQEMDCSGVCDGSAALDNCGTCDLDPDNNCSCFFWQIDCTGLCPDHEDYWPDSTDFQFNSDSVNVGDEIAYLNSLPLETLEDTLAFNLILIDSLDVWGLIDSNLIAGYDCGGECVGSNLFDGSDPGVCCDQAEIDCTNTCYGGLEIDCTYNPEDDTTWEGACGGSADLDVCSVCWGGNTDFEFPPNIDDGYGNLSGENVDCTGLCYGIAEIDVCGICASGTTEIDPNIVCTGPADPEGCPEEDWDGFVLGSDADCNGDCFGIYYEDEIGSCCDPSALGCDNLCFSGTAFDACSICLSPEDSQNYTDGLCYLFDGTATIETCSQIDPPGDTCTTGQCFAEGINADSCGLCDGTDQCISNIMVEALNSSLGIEVSWTELTGIGSHYYEVYRDEVFLDTTSNNTFFDFDDLLNYSENYCYNVSAVSDSGFIDMVYKFTQCTATMEAPDLEFRLPATIISPANLQVTIPVYLKTLTPNLPINQISMTIEFDDDVLIIDDFAALNTVLEEGFIVNGEIGDNQIQLTLESESAVVIGTEEGYEEAILELSGIAGSGETDTVTVISFNSVYANGTEYTLVSFDSMFEIINYYFTIEGDVNYYSTNLPTPNTTLQLDGITNLGEIVLFTTETVEEGSFLLDSIPPGDEFRFTASKGNTNLGAELSASDASKIARNSVGLEVLSDLELIAADVTLFGGVSGLDASRVARYSINAIDSLNVQNKHWTFYPNDIDIDEIMLQAISQGTDVINAECIETEFPGTFICSAGALEGELCDETNPICPFFQSIRLGDVTGNWVPVTDLSRNNPIQRDPVEIIVSPGEEFNLPINLVETDEIAGINITIQYDPLMVTPEGVELIGQSLIDNGYELLTNIQEGYLYIAVYGPGNLTSSEQLLNVRFSVIEYQIGISEILLTNISVNEMVSGSGFLLEIEDGSEVLTDEVIITINELGIAEPVIPNDYFLYQNIPNPFNPITEISFDLPEQSQVKLEIYDIKGSRINVLLNKEVSAGKHVILWDAEPFPAGIYFCRMRSEHYSSIQKMILLK